MAYFPFFVDIQGQNCLIVGGGMVAWRKVQVLFDYGPVITVVSPRIIPEFESMALSQAEKGRLILICRKYEDRDLEGRDFVVAATEDEAVNGRISTLCKEKKIPVNVVDVKDQCSFIFPALIKEQNIVVGISTAGKSPTAAQYLKTAFSRVIPEDFDLLVEDLGSYRDLVKARVPCLEARTAIFKKMAQNGADNGGCVTREMVEALIEREWNNKYDD